MIIKDQIIDQIPGLFTLNSKHSAGRTLLPNTYHGKNGLPKGLAQNYWLLIHTSAFLVFLWKSSFMNSSK